MTTDIAITVFEALPADGSKISGGKLKDITGLNTTQVQDAKAELKEAGLIVLGRGRGGTLSRVEGATVERPVKKTKEEALEIAREEKSAKSKAQRELDALKVAVVAAGERLFPEGTIERPGLYGNEWYVEVSYTDEDGKARTKVAFIDPEELL